MQYNWSNNQASGIFIRPAGWPAEELYMTHYSWCQARVKDDGFHLIRELKLIAAGGSRSVPMAVLHDMEMWDEIDPEHLEVVARGSAQSDKLQFKVCPSNLGATKNLVLVPPANILAVKKVNREYASHFEYRGYVLHTNMHIPRPIVQKAFRQMVGLFCQKGEAQSSWFDKYRNLKHSAQMLTRITQLLETRALQLGAVAAKLILAVINMSKEDVTVTGLCERLVDFYILANSVKDSLHAVGLAQTGFESVAFGTIVAFLPKHFQAVLLRLSAFTNIKVLDDVGIVHKILVEVNTFIRLVVEYIVPEQYISWFKPILTMAEHHMLLEEVRQVICQSAKSSSYTDEKFRERVNNVYKRATSSDAIAEWARCSNAVKQRLTTLTRLYKMCEAYNQASRVEPVCFAFEGPAGCGKSFAVSKVLKSMGVPVYTHYIPPGDKSDWYDQYPGIESNFWEHTEEGKVKEHVMLIDDLGQNGPSQYQLLMNLVSSVKMPLPCAEADKKDTKFFRSTGLCFTTNNFSKVHSNLTKTDGIDCVEALYRRPLVFDFSKVTAATATNGPFGMVYIKHYKTTVIQSDPLVRNSSWVVGPHAEVSKWMKAKKFTLPTMCDVGEEKEFLAWVAQWYTVYRRAKEATYTQVLNDEHADYVQEMMAGVPQEYGFGEYYRSVHGWAQEKICAIIDRLAELDGDFAKQAFIGAATGLVIGIASMVTQRQLLKQSTRVGERQSVTTIIRGKSNPSSMGSVLQNQVGYVTFQEGGVATAVISGHYLVTVAHVCQSKRDFVTFFRDKERDVRLIDHAPVTLVWSDTTEDVAVWQIDSAILLPFKNLSRYYANPTHTEIAIPWFIHPAGCVRLGRLNYNQCGVKYDIVDGCITHPAYTTVIYPYEGAGFCGTPLFADTYGILGQHVMKLEGQGVARIFSAEMRQRIAKTLAGDSMLIDCEFEDIGSNSSGVRLRPAEKINLSSPKENSVVEGPLYGVFESKSGPVEREPANLVWDGHGTAITLCKESLTPVKDINKEDLAFAMEVMRLKIDPFRPMSERETIKGDGVTSGLDLSTSSGPLCPSKELLVDKEAGELTELGRAEVADLITTLNEEPELRHLVMQETLKAETRPKSKGGKPRSFRVLRFPVNYELKRLSGKLVGQLSQHMWETQLCIGLNPYKHFDRLRSELQNCNVIASDVSAWDKAMLPQVQFACRDLLVEKLEAKPEEKELFRKLLTLCICSVVGANSQTFATTHSMPSGCYLTAVGNSIVHQIYTLMCYHHVYPNDGPLVAVHKIKDFVMGDDKCCGVALDRPLFNAFALQSYFEKIGLKLSNCHKEPITTPYDRLSDVEFLKRKFLWHPKLKAYVGALSPSTLYSSINFVDIKKNIHDTILGKIAAFQIEYYLHYAEYSQEQNHITLLRKKCDEMNIPFLELTESYLIEVHKSGELPYEYYSSMPRI